MYPSHRCLIKVKWQGRSISMPIACFKILIYWAIKCYCYCSHLLRSWKLLELSLFKLHLLYNTFDTRHEKTDLKAFFVVIPKGESFFWYDADFSEFDSADSIDYILEKSVSYQKKDGRGHACPSFFWHDNNKDLKVCFLMMRIKYDSAK